MMNPVILELKEVCYPRRGPLRLKNINLSLRAGEAAALLGPSGSGKSVLGQVTAGLEDPGRGERIGETAGLVSFELQRRVMAQERYRDDTNFHQGVLDPGRTVSQYLSEAGAPPERKDSLIVRFRLEAVSNRGLRFLSSGEMRKTLLCRALLEEPALLVLDDPFDGLDREARAELLGLLEDLVSAGGTGPALLLITNRPEDIPPLVERTLVLSHGEIIFDGIQEDAVRLHRSLEPRLGLEGFSPRGTGTTAGSFGSIGAEAEAVHEAHREPLITMEGIDVSYGGIPILRDIRWRVLPGEHWRIIGPNGSGKSTLLSLVTADNPKGYGQNLFLFGRRRGSGETVWEIKERIGFVSGDFHQKYLVGDTLLGVVLSGYFDSVGLYDNPSPVQLEKARLWCRRLDLTEWESTAFPNLSFGIQRAALILRALIKEPGLLIVDEPCQGLDEAYTRWVLDLLEIIAAEGASTLLFVSHDPSHEVPSIRKTLRLIPHGEGGYTAETGTSGSAQPSWQSLNRP
jgi:molybdate transport system ATP-binding protein